MCKRGFKLAVFIILLLIFALTPTPIHAHSHTLSHSPRTLPHSPAHSRTLPLTPAHSSTCWCMNIDGRMTKAKLALLSTINTCVTAVPSQPATCTSGRKNAKFDTAIAMISLFHVRMTVFCDFFPIESLTRIYGNHVYQYSG